MSRKNKVIHELEIEAMEAKGRGVGKKDGLVVFVPDTAPGDVVDVRLRKKKKSYGEGLAIQFHKTSALRQEPFCQHFEHCGGCKWQHLPYEEQLKAKRQIVADHFRAISKRQTLTVPEVLASPSDRHYRNKLEFSFSNGRWLSDEQINSGQDFDRRALGFHVPGRFDRVEHIETCYLMEEPANAIRNFVYDKALELEIPFYNIREHTGHLRTLMIRKSSTGETMVLLQTAQYSEAVQQLMEDIQTRFPDLSALLYVVNTKKNDTIFDQEVELFAGRDYIEEKLLGKTFRIQAKSFFQTNTEQAEQLYRTVLEFAQFKGTERVYDLYTGTGSIALCMAEQVKEVIGLEYIEEAIADAKNNATYNDLSNARFYAGDMKELLTPTFMEENGKPDMVVTDPPRAGMHQDVVEQLKAMAAPKIVYVSCNSATQGRDIEILSDLYAVRKIQPVDMFPQTPHIENVALLEKKSVD